MRDNIYDYLKSIGFTKEDLQKVNDENPDIFYVFLEDVRENIDFLTSKGLDKKERVAIINNNPFMLTATSKRRDAFDEIYINELKLSNEELKFLILNNNDCYTASPVELKKIVDYLISKEYTFEDIKKTILANPKVANMKFNNLEEML